MAPAKPGGRTLSDQTLIPMGFVLTLLTLAFFVAKGQAEIQQATSDISMIKAGTAEHDRDDEKVEREVLDRLARIEEQVKYIYDAVKREKH